MKAAKSVEKENKGKNGKSDKEKPRSMKTVTAGLSVINLKGCGL